MFILEKNVTRQRNTIGETQNAPKNTTISLKIGAIFPLCPYYKLAPFNALFLLLMLHIIGCTGIGIVVVAVILFILFDDRLFSKRRLISKRFILVVLMFIFIPKHYDKSSEVIFFASWKSPIIFYFNAELYLQKKKYLLWIFN